MKPIFNEEKLFLERHLGVELPDNCWRDGSKIYLNHDTKPALVNFKVDNGMFVVKTNKIEEVLEKNVNRTFDEEVNLAIPRLKSLEEESINVTKDYVKNHKGYELRVSHSGGKDSSVMYEILKIVFKELGIDDYIIDFHNTTNETADTYKYIKNKLPSDKLQIHTPDKGWYQWLREDKNYFIPNILVRSCCDRYKKMNTKKVLDKKKDYILFLGMRKYESAKRAKYDWEITHENTRQKVKIYPDNWKQFLPIVNWKDEDVYLYIMWKNIEINPMYYKGFGRVGCLICPYQNDLIDKMIQELYPTLWRKWESVLQKNYELYSVENRLKWTLEEYLNGKWKAGISKEQELIQNKATPERIRELAEIKNISLDLAVKYFQKQCCECNKKLNPDEVAINFKTYGLDIDTSQLLCKKHFCEKEAISNKEYSEKLINYRNENCSLF